LHPDADDVGEALHNATILAVSGMEIPFDTYEQALQFLFGRINYERLHAEAYSAQDLKLDRMRWLLKLLSNPQDELPAVHVAGTKGKGSTCAMVASILSAADHRAGLYISPHISAFEERMTVNGRRPSPEELVALVNRVRGPVAEMDNLPQRMPPTYFEIATALAWLYFLDQQASVAVLETGLGGRLDSTNVCRPIVTCITNISRDHTHLLGNTVRQIATEKAGIIKPGVPVVSGVAEAETIDVIARAADGHGAPLWLLNRDVVLTDVERNAPDGREAETRISVRTPLGVWQHVRVPLRGRHQRENTALALAIVDRLRLAGWEISDDAVHAGLRQVDWPARVEVVGRSPTVVIDAAHNWASAKALVTTLREEFPQRRRIVIFASTRDKDVRGQLRLLLPEFDTVILTRYVDNPRSVPPEELRNIAARLSDQPVHVAQEPVSAWKLARRLAGPDDLIVVTGSFFLVAELRDLIVGEFRESSTTPASISV
jgi:dihydrofolate synthase/folylpolyglutamate synthase